MARAIYGIKLKEHLFPARSEEDALDMQNNGDCSGGLGKDDIDVFPLVSEEHTVKLFMVAKTMYDMEKFLATEVAAAVCAVAETLGYSNDAKDIADTVTLWAERLDYMSPGEFQEWLIG